MNIDVSRVRLVLRRTLQRTLASGLHRQNCTDCRAGKTADLDCGCLIGDLVSDAGKWFLF